MLGKLWRHAEKHGHAQDERSAELQAAMSTLPEKPGAWQRKSWTRRPGSAHISGVAAKATKLASGVATSNMVCLTVPYCSLFFAQPALAIACPSIQLLFTGRPVLSGVPAIACHINFCCNSVQLRVLRVPDCSMTETRCAQVQLACRFESLNLVMPARSPALVLNANFPPQ